jgi:hypothetical protein
MRQLAQWTLPTLGKERAMILNSEGVDEDFTNSFRVPRVLNRLSPRVGNPGLQFEHTFGVEEGRFCVTDVLVNSGPQKIVKKTKSTTSFTEKTKETGKRRAGEAAQMAALGLRPKAKRSNATVS